MRFDGYVKRKYDHGAEQLSSCRTPNQAMYVTLAKFAATALGDPDELHEGELWIETDGKVVFRFSIDECDWMPA